MGLLQDPCPHLLEPPGWPQSWLQPVHAVFSPAQAPSCPKTIPCLPQRLPLHPPWASLDAV